MCEQNITRTRFRNKLNPVHIISKFGMQETKKGNPPSVEITVLMRAGKKSLTKLRGLSYYGVDEVLLTSEFSKKFATTCTHHQIQEGKVWIMRTCVC